jgi:hypothetical protein
VNTVAALHSLVAAGEPETCEIRRSTVELQHAGKTRCRFLNGKDGNVVTSVTFRK